MADSLEVARLSGVLGGNDKHPADDISRRVFV